jgi:multiple sugar transport system substrate-binding protein
MNENLKGGLGRWVPVISSIVTEDPWWLDPKEPHTGRPIFTRPPLGPTIPSYNGFNPTWGQVNAEQVWGQAPSDVIKNGMASAAAVDKAPKRAEAIFTKFTFG